MTRLAKAQEKKDKELQEVRDSNDQIIDNLSFSANIPNYSYLGYQVPGEEGQGAV
jgi:hypothetical protein